MQNTGDALQPLRQIVSEATKTMDLENPFLKAIQNGRINKEQWKTFGAQRYLAALPFTDLLKAGIHKAEKIGDHELSHALQQNIDDENGADISGKINDQDSHEQWRKDFYHALDISDNRLKEERLFNGTKIYEKELQRLARDGTALEIAGALLALEATFPIEFKKIQSGRDKTFPEKFVEQKNDSIESKKQKEKARKYIDDHIIHDAKAHFPDILNALKKYTKSKKNLAEIRKGAQKVAEVKAIFYQDLSKKVIQ